MAAVHAEKNCCHKLTTRGKGNTLFSGRTVAAKQPAVIQKGEPPGTQARVYGLAVKSCETAARLSDG